jgi:integrase
MPRPRKYPHTVSNRYGKVTIYRTQNGPYTSFKVVWQEGRTRRRESRTTEQAALDRAREVLADMEAGASARPDATAAQWAYFQQCEKMLPEGVPLIKAVEWFVKHGLKSAPISEVTVKEVVEGFIASRKSSGRSARYLQTLKYDLEKVSKALRKPIASVTVTELDMVLRGISNPRTRKNLRCSIVSCWRWARSKGWLPQDKTTAADLTDSPEIPGKDPEIIGPADLEKALRKAESDERLSKIIPYLTLAAFAGIRSAEIGRMTWEDNINLDTGVIILGSSITKTKRRRVIRMEPVLKAWLEAHRGAGKILSAARPHKLLAEVKPAAWPHNALRHSAVSYLMALHRNAALVAEQCGHTEAQLQASYKAAVTPDQALLWFNVQPTQWQATQTQQKVASA